MCGLTIRCSSRERGTEGRESPHQAQLAVKSGCQDTAVSKMAHVPAVQALLHALEHLLLPNDEYADTRSSCTGVDGSDISSASSTSMPR